MFLLGQSPLAGVLNSPFPFQSREVPCPKLRHLPQQHPCSTFLQRLQERLQRVVTGSSDRQFCPLWVTPVSVDSGK